MTFPEEETLRQLVASWMTRRPRQPKEDGWCEESRTKAEAMTLSKCAEELEAAINALIM